MRQIPALWGTTEWLERVDYGPLGNYVVIDGERMTGSRNLGGNEEVVRLDVGPYDLERETVALTPGASGPATGGHRAPGRPGRQHHRRVAQRTPCTTTCGCATAAASRHRSGIAAGTGWWHSVIRLAGGSVTVATGTEDAPGAVPWATVIPDDSYPRHSALTAIVVALGDAGGFYVDSIAIEATTG